METSSCGQVIPLNANQNAVIIEIYVNNGANMNVVNQNFVLEHDFTKIGNPLFKFEWMDGGTIYCYKIYLLIYKFQNNWHYKKQCKTIFTLLTKRSLYNFGNSVLQGNLFINGET